MRFFFPCLIALLTIDKKKKNHLKINVVNLLNLILTVYIYVNFVILKRLLI